MLGLSDLRGLFHDSVILKNYFILKQNMFIRVIINFREIVVFLKV